jgi:hypothetical protein
MLASIKHGAVFALIMCFLAQPVCAATAIVDGAAPWENSGVVNDTVAPPNGYAQAWGVGVASTYTGGSVTNTATGEIIANATSYDTDGGTYDARAHGVQSSTAGVSFLNAGSILSSATAADNEDATSLGLFLGGINGLTNTGDITVTSFTAGDGVAWSLGFNIISGSGDIINDMGALIDVSAHSTSGYSLADGMMVTSGGVFNILNNGDIIVSSYGNNNVSGGTAFGINTANIDGYVENNGLIDVTMQGDGLASIFAMGIRHQSGSDLDAIRNTGTINVVAHGAISTQINAFGIQISNVTSASNIIENTGTISVSSIGKSATIGGIYATGVNGGVYTGGDIIVSAQGTSSGPTSTTAYGVAGFNGNAVNNGTISVSAVTLGEQSMTAGIYSGGSNSNINNNGDITVLSDSQGNSISVGILGFTGGTVENAGDIFVYSTGVDETLAIGIGAKEDTVNTGTIKVFAKTSADPLDAKANGIWVFGFTGDIVSSGDIVAGSTGTAAGIDLEGTGSVTNTGTVKVAGDTSEGLYGIFLRQGTFDIASSGTIQGYTATDVMDEGTWTATNAFRTLRVGQDALSVPAAATLTSAFQVVLDGDPSGPSFLAPIFVAEGSSLDLNSQDLIATPGANVFLNQSYQIIENDGTVTGAFGGLVAGNPAITTAWSGGNNGENAEVTFDYQPAVPPAPAEVAVTMADTATDQLRQFAMSNALRGTAIAPEVPTVIVRPWAGNLNRSKKDGVGYNAGMAGVLAGVETPMTGDLIVGGHLVAGGARVDYTGTGYSQNSEDQNMFGLGAHGRYTPGNWHVDGMLTAYMVNHDYSGRTGLNLEFGEDDEYESYGVEGSLIGGHKFRHSNIVAMPFAGLGYSWINTPGHETETATGTWQTKYGSLDQHNVRAIIGARVSAEYTAFDGTITPSLGLRYEQSLTDNDISIRQSLQGASENVKGEQADGSVIVDTGLSYGRGPLTLELGGSIEKNDDYDAQSGFIGLRWRF